MIQVTKVIYLVDVIDQFLLYRYSSCVQNMMFYLMSFPTNNLLSHRRGEWPRLRLFLLLERLFLLQVEINGYRCKIVPSRGVVWVETELAQGAIGTRYKAGDHWGISQVTVSSEKELVDADDILLEECEYEIEITGMKPIGRVDLYCVITSYSWVWSCVSKCDG